MAREVKVFDAHLFRSWFVADAASADVFIFRTPVESLRRIFAYVAGLTFGKSFELYFFFSLEVYNLLFFSLRFLLREEMTFLSTAGFLQRKLS